MICSLKVPTYPCLACEFFKNLKLETELIESEVKGIEIALDQRSLRHLLEMPHSSLQNIEMPNDFEAMEKLMGRKLPKKFDINNTNLLLALFGVCHSGSAMHPLHFNSAYWPFFRIWWTNVLKFLWMIFLCLEPPLRIVSIIFSKFLNGVWRQILS